jgi:hypothetical protein
MTLKAHIFSSLALFFKALNKGIHWFKSLLLNFQEVHHGIISSTFLFYLENQQHVDKHGIYQNQGEWRGIRQFFFQSEGKLDSSNHY